MMASFPLLGTVWLTLWLQWPLDHRLLQEEDARASADVLVEAIEARPSADVARQAIRALGRFERAELSRHVVPFLRAERAELRIEAANALAQMQAGEPLAPYLASEQTPAVRGAIFEAIGRLGEAHESLFLAGLDEDEPARHGAAKGLETFLRLNDLAPSSDAIGAIARAMEGASVPSKRLLLLALDRAESPPRDTLESAFRDADAQVRRLAILGLGEYRDDPSYLVRYEGLRAEPTCARAEAALDDESPHVVLLAIDSLGGGAGCDTTRLRSIATSSDWRTASRALVALASTSPETARSLLPRFVAHGTWQARVRAAEAAKVLDDRAALTTLRGDDEPNVVAAALTSPEEALAALGSGHYGLLVRALGLLEGYDGDAGRARDIYLDTLRRLTSEHRATSRDPRRLLLERLRDGGARREAVAYLLDDFDPAIAALASDITGRPARTERFAPAPIPPEDELAALSGAKARIRMKEAGVFVIELLPEHAPVTSAQFASLAEEGYYDGLTFHRIVPNFVLQGGSPGANEYVGRSEYIRDEVTSLSHERGTLGISTRGRDTGDSQIFINLVDNFRLDHNYTVFARVVEGMDNVDQILEGDVIEGIEILRGAHPGQASLELFRHALGGKVAPSSVPGKDPLETVLR